MVSVIIPVYNEEKAIGECLESLSKQSFKNFEIIVVDDDSTDKSKTSPPQRDPEMAGQFKNINLRIITQRHQGPAIARNLGAKHAHGEILVFADADMTFDKNFIKKLVEPIKHGLVRGTFTKEEYVSNWENVFARCWNYNQGIFENLRIPKNYPEESPVFRAILKSEFEKVRGFDAIGFTDDWTLSRKLGYRAIPASGAICYHKNPSTIRETFIQSRWIGKNEFISGTIIRKMFNAVRYSIFIQSLKGMYLFAKTGELYAIVFQLVYGFGINAGILTSLLGKNKYK